MLWLATAAIIVVCLTLAIIIFARGLLTDIVPIFAVRRKRRPALYYVMMGVLLIPTLVGLALFAVVAGVIALRVGQTSIPSPPAKGYATAAQSSDRRPGQDYFPASLSEATYRCPEFAGKQPLVSKLESTWYSKHLAAAGEPTLLLAQPATARTSNVYRFTWLRSFQKPVVVRIEEEASGASLMTASRLSGAGGYEPGSIEAQVKRELTATEVKRLHEALGRARRLKLRAVTCGRGYDGAVWLFEAVDDGAYRYVNRWSPTAGPLKALGMTMLSFTGWVFDANN